MAIAAANPADERQHGVDRLLAETNRVLFEGGVDRATLKKIETSLGILAGRSDLWIGDEYAEPGPGEQQNRYLIGHVTDLGTSL